MRGKQVCAVIAVTAGLLWVSVTGRAQEKPKAAKRIAVRAGRLIDGKSETPIANALIVIEGERIVSVTAGGTAPAGLDVIDLSKATVLPGMTANAWTRLQSCTPYTEGITTCGGIRYAQP